MASKTIVNQVRRGGKIHFVASDASCCADGLVCQCVLGVMRYRQVRGIVNPNSQTAHRGERRRQIPGEVILIRQTLDLAFLGRLARSFIKAVPRSIVVE